MSVSLSSLDPNSYSRPEEWKSRHIDIDWTVDFAKRILRGHVDLHFEKQSENACDILFLDTRDLRIIKVTNDGKELRHILHDPIASFGSKLEIGFNTDKTTIIIRIEYETSTESSALQWLKPEQTSGKIHPFLFSQCQAIHARSMLPCQDTPGVKTTFNATVRAPKELQVLMGAIKKNYDQNENKHYFTQPIPISSYLIALAVGDLEFRSLGTRCGVWSEKKTIDLSAHEFSQTESFLEAGESIMGRYVWGRYDILVLPPSFPFGGMENPCLTFLTPTLLAGDKSLSNVVAHEIAHSWTGNLATNRNFEHFWLNEGFTVFLERKIVGRLMGERFRHFQALIGWKEFVGGLKTLGETNPLTNLVVDLKGVDPDDAFSIVPYEKGHAFLFYLENLVGGGDSFEPFLKSYVEKYAQKSVDSEQWKRYFLDYFENKIPADKLSEIDWNGWLNTPGFPPVIPEFDETLALECKQLHDKWVKSDNFDGFVDTKMDSLQMCYFLSLLIENQQISIPKFEALTKIYSLNKIENSEIKFRWIRLGIKSRWIPIESHAFKFVSDLGRLKFVRPIFRDLYAWEESRERTIKKYDEIKSGLMHVTLTMLAKDLHLNGEKN